MVFADSLGMLSSADLDQEVVFGMQQQPTDAHALVAMVVPLLAESDAVRKEAAS